VLLMAVAPNRIVPLEFTVKRSWRTPMTTKSKPMSVTGEARSSWSAPISVVVPLLMSVNEPLVVVLKE